MAASTRFAPPKKNPLGQGTYINDKYTGKPTQIDYILCDNKHMSNFKVPTLAGSAVPLEHVGNVGSRQDFATRDAVQTLGRAARSASVLKARICLADLLHYLYAAPHWPNPSRWLLVVAGCWYPLVAGGCSLLVVVGWWLLVAVGWWLLVAGGWWWLVIVHGLVIVDGCCQLNVGVWYQVPQAQLVPLSLMLALWALLSRLRFLLVLGAELVLGTQQVSLFRSRAVEHLLPADGGLP